MLSINCMLYFVKLWLVLSILIFGESNIFAADVKEYFLCTRSSQINLRNGPGKLYLVIAEFNKTNAPMLVIHEVDGWYNVKTKDGQNGWVMNSLLKSKSSCKSYILAPFTIYRLPNKSSQVLLSANVDSLAKNIKCHSKWCRVRIGKISGWVDSSKVWGSYK